MDSYVPRPTGDEASEDRAEDEPEDDGPLDGPHLKSRTKRLGAGFSSITSST